ncbi:hypothetical protein JXA80_03375, partial [bacterium]|nr:hypothetical protein [candidate division CSSED10-310 bacterium]
MKSPVFPLHHLISITIPAGVTGWLFLHVLNRYPVPSELVHMFTLDLPLATIMQTALISACVTRQNHALRQRNLALDHITVFGFLSISLVLALTADSHAIIPVSGALITMWTTIRAVLAGHCLLNTTSPSPHRISIGIAFLIVSLLIPLTSWRLTTRPLDGDEPYYLLQTYSLIHDHDLDLQNNYHQGDSLTFSSRRLQPQQFDDFKNNRLLSRHPPLMSLILAPGFALGGTRGALLTLTLLAGLLAALLFHTAIACGLRPHAATITALLIPMTPPVLLYTISLFTELTGAILGIGALLLSFRIADKHRGAFPVAIVVLLAAFALKPRYLLLCLPPILAGIVIRSGLSRSILRAILILFIVLTTWGAINSVIYGNPLVRHSLEDIPALSGMRLFRGVFGQWLDPQYGVLPLNPMVFLAIPGIMLMIRKISFHRSIIWSSAFLPYFLVIALFAELSGGICPRARFAVGWVPVLVVPVAMGIQSLWASQRLTWIRICIWSSLIIAGVLIAKPAWHIVFPGSIDPLIAGLTVQLNRDRLAILPGFDRVDGYLPVAGAALAACVLVAAASAYRRASVLAQNRLSPIAGVLILTGIGAVAWTAAPIWQTPFMDVEDVTFRPSGSAALFWEETRSWEYQPPSPSPYRSGIRLHPGGEVTRTLPLRRRIAVSPGRSVLEVEVRGSTPGKTLPMLTIAAGSREIGSIRLNSTFFETIRVAWPEAVGDAESTVTFRNAGPLDDPVWVDIDRCR